MLEKWIKLEKLVYDTDPPAEMEIKQVSHLMQQIADQKNCTVEFVCRGLKMKVESKK